MLLSGASLALLSAVLVAPHLALAQNEAAECAVFEALFAKAPNTTIPWGAAGTCCGYSRDKNYIACKNGRITEVELTRLGLGGQLPSLAGLTELQLLYLPSNTISGPIPALTTLTQLQRLDLSENQFTGALPSVAGLTKLVQLDLYENQLTGPFPSLLGATSLSRLDVHSNDLSGNVDGLIPSTVSTCLLSFGQTNKGLYTCGATLPSVCVSDVARGPTCPISSSSVLASSSASATTGTTAADSALVTATPGTNSGQVGTRSSNDADTGFAKIGIVVGAILAALSAIFLGVAMYMLWRPGGRFSRRKRTPPGKDMEVAIAVPRGLPDPADPEEHVELMAGHAVPKTPPRHTMGMGKIPTPSKPTDHTYEALPTALESPVIPPHTPPRHTSAASKASPNGAYSAIPTSASPTDPDAPKPPPRRSAPPPRAGSRLGSPREQTSPASPTAPLLPAPGTAPSAAVAPAPAMSDTPAAAMAAAVPVPSVERSATVIQGQSDARRSVHAAGAAVVRNSVHDAASVRGSVYAASVRGSIVGQPVAPAHWAFAMLAGQQQAQAQPSVDVSEFPPCQAVRAFTARAQDEIDLVAGDYVKLTTAFRDGYGLGVSALTQRVGVVPLDRLQIAESAQPPPMEPPPVRAESLPGGARTSVAHAG